MGLYRASWRAGQGESLVSRYFSRPFFYFYLLNFTLLISSMFFAYHDAYRAKAHGPLGPPVA